MKKLAVLSLICLLAVPATAGPGKTIPEAATAAGSFTGLLRSVQAAGLAETLGSSGPFTVFAPPDSAFAKLPRSELTRLLSGDGRADLRNLLLSHVVPGRLASPDLLLRSELKTAAGNTLEVEYREGRLTVGGARVTRTDIGASNGVIHVIDRVIVPATASAKADDSRSSADILVLAIDRGVPLFNAGHTEACVSVYEIAARSVLALDPKLDDHDRATLRGGLDRAEAANSPRLKAWALRRAFDEVIDRHHKEEAAMVMPAAKQRPLAEPTFKVTLEAPLPEGFPAPGPVGKEVLKEYPRYRRAQAEGGNAFGSLFQHIKKNDIAMTTPVEMKMDGDLRQQDMAFLYETPGQGSAGRDGRVEVQDRNPVRVLSIGLRGPLDPTKMQAARESLIAALSADKAWHRAGDLRLMGYNSPFLPASQRFYELQLPVHAHEEHEAHD